MVTHAHSNNLGIFGSILTALLLLFRFLKSFLSLSSVDTTSAGFKSPVNIYSEMHLLILVWSNIDKIEKNINTLFNDKCEDMILFIKHQDFYLRKGGSLLLLMQNQIY